MSDDKKPVKQAVTTKKAIKPQTRPRPTPKAIVPPLRGRLSSRPQAAKAPAKKRPGKTPAGTITAKAKDGEGEILLYGTIGDDFWGDGITATSFNSALEEIGDVSTIRLRVNSGGGDVFDATAIYNMLVKHDAHVIVEIEGVAASAATVISMAGDEIRISENAHFMIHSASGIAWGNAEELRQYLTLLDNADELIRLAYSKRTGISASELVSMMDHDNWMTAAQALDFGFVDAIDSAKSVTPHVTPEEDEESASNQSIRRPASLSPERLAAMTTLLTTLSASVRPTEDPAPVPPPTSGASPPPKGNDKKESRMNPKLRAKCEAAGMVKGLTDEQANKWLDDNWDKVFPEQSPPAKTEGNAGAVTAESVLDIIEAREKRKVDARKSWRKEVDATLLLAFGEQAPDGLKDTCYDLQDEGIEKMREAVSAAKKEAEKEIKTGLRVNFAPSQPRDRHIAAIRTGVLARSLRNFQSPAPKLQKLDDGRWDWVTPSIDSILDKHLPAKDRPEGWQDFAQMPLIKIAEECLVADGVGYDQIRRLPSPQLAMAAMGYHRQAGLRAAAIHTTGSLAEITRDAINKSLLAGYEEAPQTWRSVGRQGASVTDFKDIHRVKLSAAGNLPVWNDNTAPNQAKLSNEKEKYAVEARAETLSFSWRLILNDDLDALSRRPQLEGDAAGRTVNAVFWVQVTGNPTMADGQALFLETPTGNRKQGNLITGSATPTNTTIGSMRKLMRLMRGLNTPEGNQSEDILNLIPAVIAGPAALEELILKQVFSGADPAASGNSAVFNTARNLTPVIEPLLDAASATAWYLFASTSRIDTIEVTFLQGQETPYAHEWMDDETMCQNFTIIQTFGAKAIEWRSQVRHDGA